MHEVWVSSLVLHGDLFPGSDCAAEVQCHAIARVHTTCQHHGIAVVLRDRDRAEVRLVRRCQRLPPASRQGERELPPPEPPATLAGSTGMSPARTFPVGASNPGWGCPPRWLGASLLIDAHRRSCHFAVEDPAWILIASGIGLQTDDHVSRRFLGNIDEHSDDIRLGNAVERRSAGRASQTNQVADVDMAGGDNAIVWPTTFLNSSNAT